MHRMCSWGIKSSAICRGVFPANIPHLLKYCAINRGILQLHLLLTEDMAMIKKRYNTLLTNQVLLFKGSELKAKQKSYR